MKRAELVSIGLALVLLISFIASFFLSADSNTKFWALATNIGDERFYIFLAVVAFFFYPTIGILVLATILFNGMINFFIKWYFNIPRPPNPKILETGPSFPSNHAQSSGAFWTVLNFKYRSRYLILLGTIYTVFICYSRLALNVHYPMDVIAGSIIGLLVAMALFSVSSKMRNSVLLYESILLITFTLSLIGYFIYSDTDFARTSFFALGFGIFYPLIKDNQKNLKITAIAFIVWLIVALPLLALNTLSLYIQYLLLGLSAPLVKYVVYRLSK
ncbi:MAG TPA: phosphatase PAP2 family protein [Geobacterales bacterium]|nr:phosphatase PAP2 family protein [Geobacterales bacterium]